MAESTPGRMDLMPGYEVWEDGTYEMTTGDPGGLSKYYAKDTTEPWYHTVGVQHDDAFIIRPVILREGPFKDHKVLVLEPFTQTFRFLDLPPEIRTMVYGMMLKGTTATVIVSTYKPNHRPRRPCGVTFRDKLQHGEYDWDPVTCNWLGMERSFTSLFRVNKLILAEAASVFYSNTFDFESTKAMHLFLETIGSMRPYLRSLRLTGVHAYDDRVRRAIFGLLESAKDLRTIYLPLAMMRKPSDLLQKAGATRALPDGDRPGLGHSVLEDRGALSSNDRAATERGGEGAWDEGMKREKRADGMGRSSFEPFLMWEMRRRLYAWMFCARLVMR
ncbi:hypothetical protein LTR02_004629 [Friedmanniomyces endolithicus]|nr:hypothetical protein LTR94_006756 [Friedmanniomyces endolithicus]KAK0808681.1 hypothetical protein LTR59_002834 [Friedmanniomyces endolithicus]KAK0813086.1 hypothetical protein LTR38_003161 [Friedmanniomyces endolithicus]KAK0820030.1 hypothetical protein LTR75_001800 [Friedmanniomyces endolithicus]KAK0834419.1 hypothetical protein LTR03_014310 [Friedmanniomyces endolithicus]